MSDTMDRATELENRNICRICLSQEDDANFSDIFDSASLPMEILSIGSVEVFQSDGMPRKICECCKTILGNAYKFKQICKRSDTLLKMYPITGNVPPRIAIPQEMLPLRAKAEVPEKAGTISVGVGCEEMDTMETSTQTDPMPEPQFQQFEIISEEIIPPPPIFALQSEEEDEPEIHFDLKKKLPVKTKPESVKILNKAMPPHSTPPKQFKKPSQTKIERVELGKPKILNSHMKTVKYEEIDPNFETVEESIQIVSYNEEYLEEIESDVKHLKQDVSEEGIVYTCEVCEKSFPLLQQLEIHRKNHTRERNHPCDSCDKSFFSKYDLAKHVLTHTKQKDYVCIVCSKSFSRSTLLYRHEKIHTDPNIPRYECNACDRVYLNEMDYDKHVQTHMKNRPFACPQCDKSFAFKQGLERHESIHDNSSQPHACEYCEMRFPSDARLQRHLSSEHAGKRPFPCSKCTKRFMLSHHLYRHMRTSHQTEGTSYQCPECDEQLSDRNKFFAHCFDHSTSMLACPLCKLVFDSAEEANDHVQLHSNSDMYFCDYCNLIYMNQKDLHEHFDDQHSNELCSIGEEVEYIVEDRAYNKRKNSESGNKVASKKAKSSMMIYDEEEGESEIIEFVNSGEGDFVVSEIDGAAFVEYDEVDASFSLPTKAIVSPKKPLESSRKSLTRVATKKPLPASYPVKHSPKLPTVERVKLTKAKIEQLKKEGKIKMINGEMRMKT